MSVSRERWQEAHEAHKHHGTSLLLRNRRRLIEAHNSCWEFHLNFVRGYIKFGPDSKILDIGCGPYPIINSIQAQTFGIDPLLGFFRRIWEKPKGEYLAGMSERLPFKDASFDVLICINVLDHTMNPRQCLKEMNRVLKENKFLILSLNVHGCIARYYKLLAGKVGKGEKGHPYLFNSNQVERLISSHGFKIITKKSNLMWTLPEDVRGLWTGGNKSTKAFIYLKTLFKIDKTLDEELMPNGVGTKDLLFICKKTCHC